MKSIRCIAYLTAAFSIRMSHAASQTEVVIDSFVSGGNGLDRDRGSEYSRWSGHHRRRKRFCDFCVDVGQWNCSRPIAHCIYWRRRRRRLLRWRRQRSIVFILWRHGLDRPDSRRYKRSIPLHFTSASSVPATLTIDVKNFGIGTALQVNLPQSPGILDVPFSSFPSSSVFSTVGYINLHFEIHGTGSFTIDSIMTTVPEPSVLSLIAAAAFARGFVRTRLNGQVS